MVPLMLIVTLLLVLLLLWSFFQAYQGGKPLVIARPPQPKNTPAKSFSISTKDIASVAGNDVLTTQLNLARAYIETGRQALAINMLNNIILHGNSEQQSESKRLLSTIAV